MATAEEWTDFIAQDIADRNYTGCVVNRDLVTKSVSKAMDESRMDGIKMGLEAAAKVSDIIRDDCNNWGTPDHNLKAVMQAQSNAGELIGQAIRNLNPQDIMEGK